MGEGEERERKGKQDESVIKERKDRQQERMTHGKKRIKRRQRKGTGRRDKRTVSR
jgi:hypothetical protein